MSDSDSDDDVPLAQKLKAAPAAPAVKAEAAAAATPAPVPAKPKPAGKLKVEDDSSEDDAPLKARVPARGSAAAKRPASAPAEPPSAKKTKGAAQQAVAAKAESNGKKRAASPAAQNGKKAVKDEKPAAKPAAKTTAKAKAKDGSDDGEQLEQGEPSKKWYEDGGEDVEWVRGGEKWKTLEHAGVIFPPPYEPHGVVFHYDKQPVKLTPEQEEVATMYAAMLGTDYAKKPVFNKNFMASWRPLLKKTPEAKVVKDLTKCDFSRIISHLETLQAAKKEMTTEQKKAIKATKDEAEKDFIFALVDGQKEKVGNFRVEPPGLFRGRGEHPKMGQLKARIMPEDVTLNMSAGKSKVPPVPDMGDGKKHKWGEIVHKNNVTWLAKWTDSINGEPKCVWLAANSSWKGMSDMAKYQKARELKQHITKVRADYTEGMASKDEERRQRAVAVYLIDRLALRVGNEKNTDEEADTVGCCSLRVEHVKMDCEENHLHLNFLGKDSIVYDNTTPVLPKAFELIQKFMKKKGPTDLLFDKVEPSALNDYFKSVMPGLSAKVFRTYNASVTLDSELQKTAEEVTDAQRKKEGDINALCAWYTIANKNVAELCNHQKAASASFETQIAKFDEKIAAVKEEQKAAKKAKDTKKMETLQKKLDKLEADKRLKDATKCVSLGTSKINYNDPRITTAWCKKWDVPIHKQFPKTLLAKFAWAMAIEPEYRF